MEYHKVIGDAPTYTTGTPTNTWEKLQDGFDRFECGSLDAPECLPAGGTKRYEFESQLRPVMLWFEMPLITLRGSI